MRHNVGMSVKNEMKRQDEGNKRKKRHNEETEMNEQTQTEVKESRRKEVDDFSASATQNYNLMKMIAMVINSVMLF